MNQRSVSVSITGTVKYAIVSIASASGEKGARESERSEHEEAAGTRMRPSAARAGDAWSSPTQGRRSTYHPRLERVCTPSLRRINPVRTRRPPPAQAHGGT